MAETGEVQLHFLDYWRVVKNRWGIIALTFLLVVVTTYITTYFMPRGYSSKVLIEVKPDNFGLQVFPGAGGISNTDSHFVANQFIILQSKEILYPVIDSLGLIEKWTQQTGVQYTKDTAYTRLFKMLHLQDKRGTDMLEIEVTSGEPQEAADISNTVAVVYQKRRLEDQSKLITQNLAELTDEIEKQRKKVDDASAEAAKIRIKENIVDTNPDSSEMTDFQPARSLLVEEGKLNEAKQNVQALKTKLDKIDTMSPDELMNALSQLGIPQDTVSAALGNYREAKGEEAKLRKLGLGENHPRLQSLEAQEEVWKKQLDEGLVGIKTSLENQLSITQNILDKQQKVYDDAKKDVQDFKAKIQEYIAAKENYINAKRLLDAAEQRLETEKLEIKISTKPAEIWETAEPARIPSSPVVSYFIFGGIVAGLGLGIGLAFFLEYLDTSVKTLADVEKFIGVSVLAVVPKIGGLIHKSEGGRSPDAETYRTLRTNIDFHKPSPDANTITIISGGPGEGKSTTLCNLAVIYANAGSNVLVVDADLRRPTQHKFFDLDGNVGLVNYVTGEKEFEEVILPTSVENLWLLPSGPSTKDPVAVLNSHRVVELIARAKTQFDVVLFDSPPILGLSDGAVLSSAVEMTVMVVQHRRFPRASLLRVKQAVLNVGGNLTGVVLNRVDTRDDQNYYYYTSYYDYYAPTPREKEKEPQPGGMEL